MSKFKELLKNNHITQNELARELGVHQTLISQWCSGKGKPSILHVAALSRYIGVSTDIVIDCFNKKRVMK